MLGKKEIKSMTFYPNTVPEINGYCWESIKISSFIITSYTGADKAECKSCRAP